MTLNGDAPSISFVKYQALGNDYLVMDPVALHGHAPEGLARQLCDRHYGAGADGLLVGPYPDSQTPFGLRIFNPDGSETEKSGNGLRIFARYLFDQGLVETSPFQIRTLGGMEQAVVKPVEGIVSVTMGAAVFESLSVPVLGKAREVLEEPLRIAGKTIRINAVSFGNPHCVIFVDHLSKEQALTLGPQIENHNLFPQRTNVQFVKVLNRNMLEIQIWERGAGYTLSSGSSACAAGAVAFRLGRCSPDIQVNMPGGMVAVSLSPAFEATLTGPVRRVYEGKWQA